MTATYVLCHTLITLCGAQISPRADETPNVLRMPSELESLVGSVQLQASSAVNTIETAYSHAATVAPADVIEDMNRVLPIETPTSNPATDGAVLNKASYLGSTLGVAVVAVLCSALG
jgi:hypothetical protein